MSSSLKDLIFTRCLEAVEVEGGSESTLDSSQIELCVRKYSKVLWD